MLIFAELAKKTKDNEPAVFVMKGAIYLGMNVQNTKVKILTVVLCMFLGVMGFAKITGAATTGQITQYGFTFHFNKQHTYGQFANGDYWVVGPVTITRIQPDFDGKNYGWEVNPTNYTRTGLQDGCAGGTAIDLNKIPSLPYTAQPKQSIVKASPSDRILSGEGSSPCLKAAAVLTVVGSAPPGNGADIFRPPYIGSDKPYYYVSDLRTNLLPSLTPIGRPPTLAWVEDRFKRVQLDHPQAGFLKRSLHPTNHMPDYGATMGRDHVSAALRLMLNDSIVNKQAALIQFIQFGIDQYHNVLAGQKWASGGGHTPGHLLPLAFFAAMLGDQGVKNRLAAIGESEIHEKKYIRSRVDVPDEGIFGGDSTESQYWTYTCSSGGSNYERKDPYGYIDGGGSQTKTFNDYQGIVSPVWKGEVLAAYLMPELIPIYNSPKLFGYIDR